MYQAYWGLADSPFRGHQNPRSFFQGPAQDEALARLHFLVDERRTLGLLLGGPGSGKSLVLEVFARQLGNIGRQTALVNLALINAHEFLWLLAGQLGVEVTPQASVFTLSRRLSDHISANRYQQITTTLLLDDAELAHSEVTDHIVRLAQLDASREARLTVVLAASPERAHKLGNRLLDLSDLRVDLLGWEAEHTAEFVKWSLGEVGRSTPIFSADALVRLQELTGGVPRRVKQLADLALLAGAGSNLAQIEADTIDSVYQELGVRV